MSYIEKIYNDIVGGKIKDIQADVKVALDNNCTAKDILNSGMIPAMMYLGGKFKNNEIFVPQVLISSKTMNLGLDIIRPVLLAAGVKPVGKAIICTVKGDLHDIGKNLVKMMMEGNGIECIDLGVDVDGDKVVSAILQYSPDIVCLSALLTTTMISQKMIVDKIVEKGLRDKVKIMIGGAPVTQEFCDEIGADAYTPDAATAAEVAISFCKK